MSAYSERVEQDIRKIEQLSISVHGKIKIIKKSGNPVNTIIVELNYPTAPSNAYPRKIQNTTEVKIELLSRYPFQEPTATIVTPIFHPNVYASGKICLGTKWLPTQGLDLLVKRIVQIITFDETVVNEKSPANGTAALWYKDVVRKHPEAFPTEKLILKPEEKKTINWNNIDAPSTDRVVISCPKCKGQLRVKSGQKGNLTCPKCSNKFYIET